jgi:hypothetical protein
VLQWQCAQQYSDEPTARRVRDAALKSITEDLAIANKIEAEQKVEYTNRKEEVNSLEIFADPAVSCVRLWSMAAPLNAEKQEMGVPPVYSIIQNIIRSDEAQSLTAALPIIRGINAFCCIPNIREHMDEAKRVEACQKHPMYAPEWKSKLVSEFLTRSKILDEVTKQRIIEENKANCLYRGGSFKKIFVLNLDLV